LEKRIGKPIFCWLLNKFVVIVFFLTFAPRLGRNTQIGVGVALISMKGAAAKKELHA